MILNKRVQLGVGGSCRCSPNGLEVQLKWERNKTPGGLNHINTCARAEHVGTEFKWVSQGRVKLWLSKGKTLQNFALTTQPWIISKKLPPDGLYSCGRTVWLQAEIWLAFWLDFIWRTLRIRVTRYESCELTWIENRNIVCAMFGWGTSV